MAKEDETKLTTTNAPPPATTVEDPKGITEPDTRDKEIVELKQKLEASDRKLTEVQTTLLSPQYQQQVREQQPSGSYQPPYGQQQVSGGEDLEAMDNAQLARTIEDRVGRALDTKLKVVGDYITQLDQRTTQDKIEQSIASTKSKYKFFDNYKTSMIDTAARIRKEGVNALDILKIASWQQPAQVPKEETVTTEKPTQTTSAPPSTEKLSMQERIEKIYDEKVGKK